MKIRDIGEFGLIEEIRKLAFAGGETIEGIGDDAAVIAPAAAGRLTLFTADILLEGRHFDLAEATPYRVGWKALACSLSDIAAMGGLPRAALVNIALSGKTDADFVRELYRGLNDLARRAGCSIVGGDTAGSTRGLVISVAVVGEVEEERLALRSGAAAGDLVWVTGRLGGSRRGRHLDFMPRLEEARFIVGSFPVKAMIDLSDGLASDARRIAEASGVGIRIEPDLIPLSREVVEEASGSEAIRRALHDGEDFELLVVLAPARPEEEIVRAFAGGFSIPFTRIGEVIAGGPGVTLRREGAEEPVAEGGFSHFG